MHDCMPVPYDPIQGQGQGQDCLKATQRGVDRQSRTGLIFVFILCYFLCFGILCVFVFWVIFICPVAVAYSVGQIIILCCQYQCN